MSALVKLGAVAAIGAVGTGVAVTTVSLKGGFSVSIPWTSLKDEEHSHKESSKVGKAFGSFLVGVYGADNKNEVWWNHSYSTYLKDKAGSREFSDEFAKDKVKDAFTKKTTVVASATTSSKSLNLICNDVYGKTKTDVRMPEGGLNNTNDTNKKLREDFWRYCSPLGSDPQSIKDVNNNGYDNSSIGKTKESELLSAWEQDILWSIKEKDFFKLEESSITPLMFKNFRKDKSQGKSLRDLCDSAYSKTSSSSGSSTDATKISDTEVVKYCSLEDQ